MRAILSGQVGVALVRDGDAVWSVTVESPDERTKSSWTDVLYLFADADDAVELDDVSPESVIHELAQAWRRDRALQLTLILLDGEEDAETRTMSAECVDEHFTSDEIAEFVANRLYSAPLPSGADVRHAKQTAADANAKRVGAFLEEIEANQTAIATVRRAWERIELTRFGVDADKSRFEAAAIDSGAFRILVQAKLAGNIDQSSMECLSDSRISQLPDYSQIMSEWIASIGTSNKKRPPDATFPIEREAKTSSKRKHDRGRTQPRAREAAKEPKEKRRGRAETKEVLVWLTSNFAPERVQEILDELHEHSCTEVGLVFVPSLDVSTDCDMGTIESGDGNASEESTAFLNVNWKRLGEDLSEVIPEIMEDAGLSDIQEPLLGYLFHGETPSYQELAKKLEAIRHRTCSHDQVRTLVAGALKVLRKALKVVQTQNESMIRRAGIHPDRIELEIDWRTRSAQKFRRLFK